MGIKITDGLLPPVTEDDTIYLHEKCTSSEYTYRPGVGSAGAVLVFYAFQRFPQSWHTA